MRLCGDGIAVYQKLPDLFEFRLTECIVVIFHLHRIFERLQIIVFSFYSHMEFGSLIQRLLFDYELRL